MCEKQIRFDSIRLSGTTTAGQFAAIRNERDLNFWEAIRDIPTAKRKRESLLHDRSGPQVQFSTIFSQVWGLDRRTRLHSCPDVAVWKSQKKAFIEAVCEKLDLPRPPSSKLPETIEKLTGSLIEEDTDYKSLPTPKCLKRDNLWLPQSTRTELEFVVDNKTLAQLLNLEVRVGRCAR